MHAMAHTNASLHEMAECNCPCMAFTVAHRWYALHYCDHYLTAISFAVITSQHGETTLLSLLFMQCWEKFYTIQNTQGVIVDSLSSIPVSPCMCVQSTCKLLLLYYRKKKTHKKCMREWVITVCGPEWVLCNLHSSQGTCVHTYERGGVVITFIPTTTPLSPHHGPSP